MIKSNLIRGHGMSSGCWRLLQPGRRKSWIGDSSCGYPVSLAGLVWSKPFPNAEIWSKTGFSLESLTMLGSPSRGPQPYLRKASWETWLVLIEKSGWYFSRFTTDGELPVIQSAHNEELAALKLKMKKVMKNQVWAFQFWALFIHKTMFTWWFSLTHDQNICQIQEDNRRMTNLEKEKDSQVRRSQLSDGCSS